MDKSWRVIQLRMLLREGQRPPGEDRGVWMFERFEAGPLGAWEAWGRMEMRVGKPVVAELRLVPAGRLPATWAGIVPRVVRRISFEALGRHLVLAAAGYHHFSGTRDTVAEPLFRELGKLRGLATDPRPRPRRQSGRDDRFYAEVARDYLALASSSRRPVADLAAARGERVARMRDAVQEAKERGLLKRHEARAAGGVLTARAEELLRTQAPGRKRRARR